MLVKCHHCKSNVEKSVSQINRAKKVGAKLFCSKACFGINRRIEKTDAQKKAEKKTYDEKYRVRDPAAMKEKKAAYFKKTYDPVMAAIKRKERMPKHVEYCRQDWYKKLKSEYDRKRRAEIQFGEFSESFLVLQKIEAEIASRITKSEIAAINGTLNKSQTRRRKHERTNSNKS